MLRVRPCSDGLREMGSLGGGRSPRLTVFPLVVVAGSSVAPASSPS